MDIYDQFCGSGGLRFDLVDLGLKVDPQISDLSAAGVPGVCLR